MQLWHLCIRKFEIKKFERNWRRTGFKDVVCKLCENWFLGQEEAQNSTFIKEKQNFNFLR